MGLTSEPHKHSVALDLLSSTDFGLSGQVMAEFCYNAKTRKGGRIPLDDDVLDQWLAFFEACTILPIDSDIVRQGVLYARSYGISYWDAAIIAAAERLRAPVLYTEDLNHGQLYGSVKALNPFRPS